MPDEPNDEIENDDTDFDLDDLDFDDEDEDEDDLSLPDFDAEMEKAKNEPLEIDEPEETAEEEAQEEAPTQEEAPAQEEAQEEVPEPAAMQTAPAPIEGSREDLDFILNVEVGRVSIPMSKLIELEAGNVMELGVSAEQGVDLVVGGRCIGRGELVKIGPKVAVRILSIQ